MDVKSFKLIIFLFFWGSVSVFSQDTIHNSVLKKEKQKQDGRAYIRIGIGAQGMISFIFPQDINSYSKDFYNSLKDYYEKYGFSPSSGESPPPIFIGYGYSFKIDIRVMNIFQLEPWWDQFNAFPLNMKVDFYYSDTYNNINERQTATYKFQPFYDDKGLSLLFVPGSKRKSAFFIIGGGMGLLQGKFRNTISGTHSMNGVITDLSGSETYSGKTISYHGVFGITFVPWNFLELELLINGRYAKIPSIKNADGAIFKNEFRDNEVVSLNFSGADIRFGLKFIFP